MAYSDNFSEALTSLVDSMVSADKLKLSEMLYEKSFAQGDITDSHRIVTDVRHGHTVPILKDTPNPDSFPFVDETSCVATDCDVSHEYSAKSWEVKLIECRVGICMRSFDEDFLLFWNAYRHTQEGEPNLDTAILQFISDKFQKNHQLAQWRVAYFADTSSGSALYNGLDGFFVQAEANPELVVPITENGGGTFALQAITGEAVYDYLSAMYDKAINYPWFDPASFEFKITRSMGLQLMSWLNKLGLKAPSNCTCYDANAVTQTPRFTLDNMAINGVPIQVRQEWDSIINYSTVLNGGGGANARVNPHRAILTYRDNMLIGTSETDALQSLDIWYSKDDKKSVLGGIKLHGSVFTIGRVHCR